MVWRVRGRRELPTNLEPLESLVRGQATIQVYPAQFLSLQWPEE
jgi:hypothetical protein